MSKIDWEKEKDNLEELIKQHLTFTAIARLYGIKKGDTIKRIAIKLGIKIINPKTNTYYEVPETKFICKHCGKEFDNKYKLSGHSTFCKKNPKYEHNLETLEENRKNIKNSKGFSIINEEKICYCKFCGKECKSLGALDSHERLCKHNPNGYESPLKKYTQYGHVPWNKGKTMLDDERILKATRTRKEHILNGEIKIESRPHTEESKEKIRKKLIEYIKNNGNGEFGQHYSIKGCEYIDNLNKHLGWQLKHAKNGGEKEVCGYFLDGYDENLNIAFEYDEPYHYKDVYNNILNEKDIKRQNLIIERLHCDFYRYNEKMNLFYKVN